MKRNLMLYISEDVIEKLKSRNINISEIVERLLRMVLEHEGDTSEELLLSILEARSLAYQKELDSVNERLTRLQETKKACDAKIAELKPAVDMLKKSRKIAALMRTINYKIESTLFDVESSWSICQEEIQLLAELQHEIDKSWFEKHVERLKTLRGTV